MLVEVLVRVSGAAEGGEPFGDVVGDVAHMVEEGAETLLGDFALVKSDGLDLVVPGAEATVDGEVLRGEVVVEEVPVVFGCLDIEFYLLNSLIHIDLGFDVDVDAQRCLANANQANFAFAVESEDGIVLPADVVEEHGGAHGVGDFVEETCGAVHGVDGATLVGTEMLHQGVAHFGIGGHADGGETQFVLELLCQGVDDIGGQGEGESEDGGEVVVVAGANAHVGGTIAVE